MSLRDFKQTLLLVESSQAATWARGDRKAPPKGRLRDQLACIERQAADLECTVVGDSLPPSLPSPSPPPSLFSSSLSPISPQRPKLCHPSTTQIRPPKRIKLSDYAPALVIELCLRGGNSCAQEIEAHGIGGAEQSCCVNGLELEREQRQHDDEEEEEGGGGSVVRADSEAGPFIQSQTEGLQEPLVLWPPLGGGNDEVGGIVEVPASINGRLMPHQREGVKFLYSLYRANKGGVLGDDMGLGKTIQVIAFLAAVLQSDHSRVKTRAEGDKYELLKQRKQVLVVAPTSVLGNWEQEFHAWGAFEVAIYHGAHRESVLRKLESRTLQIVLTSFDTFRIHGESLCTIDWDCMVVDEAHRLKNDKSDLYKAFTKVQTRRRYGLTGTIMQNKIMDLFNVFDWAAPGCLGSREHFREYYDEPLKQGQRISAPERFIKLAEDRRLHLTKVLQNVLLRREKHDTIGHLMKGKEDNVIFCEMSPLQRRVYKRLLASPDFECLAKKGELCTCGGPLTRAECCFRTVSQGIIWQFLHRESVDGCDSCPYCLILPCLTKLQQVSNHLELIKPNIKDDPEKQKKDELLAEYVLAEDAGLIGGTAQEESFLGLSDTQHCGKMRALELLLAHWVQQGDKVLLFSYSVRMLDILDKFLIRKGYCFSRLDGSTAMNLRQSLVDDFNRSPSKQVFLISTRAGGLGLNLVSANRVVIFDPNWNPAQDLQAQDRSFRFGQRRHVTVYRLLAAGSLEELVYTRQIYKQQLFNIAVSGNLEKRYFEGVQDSKDHRGELFGISNLFRDLSERVFTSEIIEEHDKRVHHFHVESCATGTKVMNEVRAGGGEGVKPKKCSESQWSIGGNAVPKKSSVKKCSKETLAVVLKDAGVVYAHRNEDVVNCKAVASKYNDDAGKEKTTAKRGTLCPPATHRPAVDATKAKCISKPAKQSLKKMSKDRFLASDRMSRGKLAQSKEEQFACLAKFKGMEIAEFCKWLLSLSETEKQNLLLDFNQKKKQVV